MQCADNQQVPPPHCSALGGFLCTLVCAESQFELIDAISGYGRELFFSNLIAYIANKYPNIINSTLAGYLPDGNFGSVEREYHHTDLTFFDSADSKKRNPVLVVENKFGSIATAEQLNKYTSKFSPDEKKRTENKPGCRFLLISPNRLDCTTAQNARWDFLTYSEFGRELEKHVDREASSSSATITSLDYMLLRAAAAYMILTYRIPVREKTVKELIEQICQWTRLALENRQKTSENKQ